MDVFSCGQSLAVRLLTLIRAWLYHGEWMANGSPKEEIILLDAFKSCIKSKDLALGKHIHTYMVITKIKLPVFFLNIIVDMYAKCGSLQDACVVFDSINRHDLVSWNVMISSQAKHGGPEEAIKNYKQMELVGLSPDHITYLGVLDACTTLRDCRLGNQIHVQMALSGLKLSNTTTNSLIHMYSRCSSMHLACKVFDEMDDRNVISWNSILSAYAMHKDAGKVLEVFNEMERDSVKPDEVSYLSILNACAGLGDLELGKDVHAKIIETGIKLNLSLENALLDMYAKCGSLEIASQIFNQMTIRNVISWTVIIAAHSSVGNIDDALFFFQQMTCEGASPNDVTILSIICACSSFGELKKGKQLHTFAISSALDVVINVGNAIVDMYSKCGSLTDARRCFNNMKMRDVVTWNTMVSAYAKHGHGTEVLELVQCMKKDGFKLDSATLTCVLSACSRSGLVLEGLNCFDLMEGDDGIFPAENHYACMVDLLGRAGHLEIADDLYKRIPDEANLASWRTLLGACRIHGDIQRAKAVAESTIKSVEPGNAQASETLSNMHSFLASSRRG